VSTISEADLRVAFTALVAQHNAQHALEGRPPQARILVGDLDAADFDELYRIVGEAIELLCSSSLDTTPEFRARSIDLLARLAREGSSKAVDGVVSFAVWDDRAATRDHAANAVVTIDPVLVAERCRHYVCKPAKFDHPIMCRAAALLAMMPDHPAVTAVAREASRRRVPDIEFRAALNKVLAR
jgi:hypothetical protein